MSVANATPGRSLAYSATLSTSTTPAMLVPQWQTKTPTRGSSPTTSRSGGYSLSTVSVPRESARPVITCAAAAEAWATLSGMSLGSPNGPQTKTPSRVVSSGWNSCSSQKPCRLRSTPSVAGRLLRLARRLEADREHDHVERVSCSCPSSSS